ncbi:hypothetical protein KW805_00705 [Candidatus Pacearchaeota archaeon]|nr:hypothetical protein [Candidatus Pacearchaeota archaeon]
MSEEMCPECGSDQVDMMPGGSGVYMICRECGYSDKTSISKESDALDEEMDEEPIKKLVKKLAKKKAVKKTKKVKR